jgi:hypothetical protein
MENFYKKFEESKQEICFSSPEIISHQLEEDVNIKEYRYDLENNKKISIIFKNQEQLLGGEIVKDRTVVNIGELPYCRDTQVVRENIKELESLSKDSIFFNSKGKFGRKMHLGKMVGSQDFYDKNPVFAYEGIKPRTDLLPHDITKINSSSEKEGEALFIIDNNINSLAEVAQLLNKIFKESDISIDESFSSERIEEAIMAMSIDSEGRIREEEDFESRRLILEAILGNKKSKDIISQHLKNKDKIVPDAIYLAIEYLSYFKKLIKEIEGNAVDELEEKIKVIETCINNYCEAKKFFLDKKDIEKFNEHVVIHMTNYYPITDNEGKWYIPNHSQSTGGKVGRLSTHFSIDGIATAAGIGGGSWSNFKYAVVAPLGDMILKNGPMSNALIADTYWIKDPTSLGVLLPESSTLIANRRYKKQEEEDLDEYEKGLVWKKEKDKVLADLSHRGPDKGIKKITSSLSNKDSLARLLNERYGVKIRDIGNDYWHGDSWKDSEYIKLLYKVFPYIPLSRHQSSLHSRFERMIQSFLEGVLLSDQVERIKSIDLKEAFRYNPPAQKYFTEFRNQGPEKNIAVAKKTFISKFNKENTRQGYVPEEMMKLMLRLGLI